MNDIQKHLIGLLQEIDEICAANAIPYLLGGRTAKDACQSHQLLGDYVFASVMMRDRDFNKFRAAVKEKEGRAVESILENPDYPDGLSMRYVDETTTFLYGHTAHRYRCKGIYVTVQKCRRVPGNKIKAKLANAIDNAVTAIGNGEIRGSMKKKPTALLLRLLMKVLGKVRVIRLLLKVQNRLIRGGKSLAFLRAGKPNVSIPASMFTNAQRVELEGAAFYVPADADAYLKKVFGKNWQTDYKPEPIASPHLLVCSTRVGYKEIDTDDTLYAHRAQVDKVIEKRRALTARIQALRSQIEKYWDLLFLTKERYELYRGLVPVLPELQDALSKGAYGWLDAALADYVAVLREYVNKDMPLVIHAALDELVLSVLTYRGDHGLVQKCENLKKKWAFHSLSLPLEDKDRQEALRRLPAVIAVAEDAGVPVYVRCEEQLLPVAVPDEEGQPGPVLIRREDKLIPVDGITAQSLLVQTVNGAYVPLLGYGPCKRLFADLRAIPLVQCVYGQDRKLAWVDGNACVYAAASFGADDLYQAEELPHYVAVNEDKEVPLYFYDERCAALRRVFCVDAVGGRAPVATLGLGGTLWVTPGAAASLHFENDNGAPEPLTVDRFTDAGADSLHRALGREQAPAVCCPLVQEDAFGRRMAVAALCTDGRVLPRVRLAADGTAVSLELGKADYATLCLRRTDGTDVPLISVDAEGAVLYAAQGHTLPVRALIDGMKA